MNNIYITDYIDDPIIEREILGDELAKEYNDAKLRLNKIA